MYSYEWDETTGGLVLTSSLLKVSKEPRPVYYQELDLLGFDKYWTYEKNDTYPYMWAEANHYFYRGRKVAEIQGGSCYTAPELKILDSPEPEGTPLRFVDIPAMIEKNKAIMESLVQETIKRVYNTYKEYKDKIDIFYVAFSGGKDSIVALDIVQRALPHNAFRVLFGDTRMEFPDTYAVVDKIEKECLEKGILFYRAFSELSPEYTWNTIGPPAQKMRWCCSLHKSAPQILLLRNLTGNPHFRGMAMMGVRGDESVTRSRYEDLNFGTKHQGQYDFYPIFSWNSAELFIYMYQENLIMNETYKFGNSRAGCLVCPMEGVKNTWFKQQLYQGDKTNPQTTSFYNHIIFNQTIAHDLSDERLYQFMNIGVWKSRHNGSKLLAPREIYHEEKLQKDYVIILDSISVDWKEWIKTVGEATFLDNNIIHIYCGKNKYIVEYMTEEERFIFKIKNIGNSQKDIYFLSWMKVILKKSAYCINCRVCEANCPNGFITMKNGKIHIDNNCTKCKKCYKVNGGCLVASSQLLPKEANKMNGSIDQYKNMGVQYSWVKEYFENKDDFWSGNSLGSQMVTSLTTFLRQANVSMKKKITKFGEIVTKLGVDSISAWALMVCNLAYSPQFNWWINEIEFDRSYTHAELDEMLKELSITNNSRKNILSAFKNIFYSNPILSTGVGLGIVSIQTKGKNTYLVDAKRTAWKNPDPRVILYSLYKFAEACDGYYQFTLTRLLNHDVESEGVSPTEIFGLSREQMEKILNGLAINYSEFISISFTLDLDNINLNSEKTAEDVLTLF